MWKIEYEWLFFFQERLSVYIRLWGDCTVARCHLKMTIVWVFPKAPTLSRDIEGSLHSWGHEMPATVILHPTRQRGWVVESWHAVMKVSRS